MKNIKFARIFCAAATRKSAYAADPKRKMESEESRICFFTMIKSYLNVSQVYDNVVPALPKFLRGRMERERIGKGKRHLSGNEMA